VAEPDLRVPFLKDIPADGMAGMTRRSEIRQRGGDGDGGDDDGQQQKQPGWQTPSEAVQQREFFSWVAS
jgi:hypothetical protein